MAVGRRGCFQRCVTAGIAQEVGFEQACSQKPQFLDATHAAGSNESRKTGGERRQVLSNRELCRPQRGRYALTCRRYLQEGTR